MADCSIRLGAGGTIPGEISPARNTQPALSPRGELCFPFQSVRCIFFSFHLQTIDAVITGWAPEAEKIFARSRSDNPTLPSPDLPCFLIPPTVSPPPPPDRSVATGVGPRVSPDRTNSVSARNNETTSFNPGRKRKRKRENSQKETRETHDPYLLEIFDSIRFDSARNRPFYEAALRPLSTKDGLIRFRSAPPR